MKTKTVSRIFSRIAQYASRARFLILLILLLAFFLRAYQLDQQALRGDEAATVHYSALPVSLLWELSRVTDPHPPLYYLLLHPWQWLLGKEAWLMRFTGVIAGVLSVAALFTLARLTLRSVRLSLLAAALLALNPLQIWLAQDLRSYPIFTLLGLLSSWALWLALNPKTQRTAKPNSPFSLPWFLYIFFTTACLYIHYYTVFFIAFQGLFVLLNFQKYWSQKWPWLASQMAIGLLIIPGLYLASHLWGQAAGGIDVLSTADILRLTSTALLTGFTIDSTRGLWASLLLAPVWLMGLITLLRRNFTTGTFWGLFFAGPVLGVIALSIGQPFFKERFLIQAHPAFELLLAAGFLALWQLNKPSSGPQSTLRHTLRPLALISPLLLSALLYFNLLALQNYFTNPLYAKAPPWHLYHHYVSDNARPEDLMLTNFPEAAVSYYSPAALPFRVIPDERDRSTAARLAEIESVANQFRRIWFLPLLRQGFDEQGDVLNWLDRHADRVDQTFFPVFHVNLYLTPPAIANALVGQPAAFAHGVRLRGYQIFNKAGDSRLTGMPGEKTHLLTLEPGDEFTLSLYWQANGPTPTPYTVFTHLIAANGFNQAGQDNQPVWGTYPTTAWQPGEKITDKYTLTLPQGLPSGDYRLHVGWYQADTLARTPVLAEDGRPLDDHLILSIIIRVE
ncbi:MAG: glycosyltransferase family 39 protein [Anaerolineae bacterium]|nr:glycosyltransferase family 39 protein [Anaerolineae bacterium]